MTQNRTANLYRMVLPDHTCPYGVRAKELLEQAGYEIEEHLLESRDEVEAFKEEHGLETTPLVCIGDERVGGSDELADYLESAATRA